jgi:hypothetical protein
MIEGYKVLFKGRYGYEYKSISQQAKEVTYKKGWLTMRSKGGGPLAVFKDYDSAMDFSKGALYQYVAKCRYKKSKELCLYNIEKRLELWVYDCPENTDFADEVIIDEIIVGPTLAMED